MKKEQGLPPNQFLLKMNIAKQKPPICKISFKSVGKNFIRKLDRKTH
jgi:hypothetical protein